MREKQQAYTVSQQNYLKAIYMLGKSGAEVHSVNIADYFGVSRPSVCRAMQGLQQRGLVTLDEEKNLALTPQGKKEARAVVRKNKVLFNFLVNILGISPEAAQYDADRLEHAISGLTLQKLQEYILQMGYKVAV